MDLLAWIVNKWFIRQTILQLNGTMHRSSITLDLDFECKSDLYNCSVRN